MTNSDPFEQSTMDRLDSKRLQVLSALEAMWHTANGQPLVAEQIMTPQPVCVSRETTLPELVNLFHERHFRHLLVTDAEGRLQGLISDRDVLRMMGPGTAYKEVLEGILAGEIMSSDLVTIGPRTSMAEAIGSMVDHGISSLPVVEGGRLLGIVTSTDSLVLLQMLLQAIRAPGSEQPAAAEGN